MPKILISDKLSPKAARIMQESGLEVDIKTGLKPQELREIIGGYDGLAVRSATRIDAPLLAAAKNLKIIGRAGIGLDNIDVQAATQAGVVVMNTPYGNAVTTAEHAIAMMFALARQIPQANVSTHQGKWEKSRFVGVELTGKTLGLIGAGNIGAVVADRALGLHMRVIVYDPFLSAERAADLAIEKVEFEDLLSRADFVSLHTPLTDATRGLIDAKALAKMRPGAFLINCARGGLIVEEDLKTAIESGHIAGAALDTFQEEPATQNPLFGMEQVICTPHLGATTHEALDNTSIQIAQQMAEYLTQGAVTNAVNAPSLSTEDAPKLRPYLKLAEQLGSFAGQLTENALQSVKIEFEGHVAELNTRPLTAVALAGLLGPLLESVNMVNAPLVAKERGIGVTESKNEQSTDYHTVIRLTVTTDQRTRSVAGTLFSGDKPRIVEIKQIPIEAELGPHMLYVTNLDKPGFIGRLGTVLAEDKVNIATFHLGRTAAGSDAIALIQVDQPITEAILAKVCAIPGVLQAKALHF